MIQNRNLMYNGGMDFREIGFKRFLKHYGERHLFEKVLKDAYEAGYEEGWRDKHDKNVRESPQNVLFVFEEAYECNQMIKDALIDKIVSVKNHEIVIKGGTKFFMFNPEQIFSGALHNVIAHKAFIDSEHVRKGEMQQIVFQHLAPADSESCFVPFSDVQLMNFKEF